MPGHDCSTARPVRDRGHGLSRRESAAYGVTGRHRYAANVTHLSRVLGDAILHQELATLDSLAARVATARRARGVRLARQTLLLLDGRAQSPPESLIRLRLLMARLPAPTPQLAVNLGWEDLRDGSRQSASRVRAALSRPR